MNSQIKLRINPSPSMFHRIILNWWYNQRIKTSQKNSLFQEKITIFLWKSIIFHSHFFSFISFVSFPTMAARLAQTAVHQLESVKLVLSPMNQSIFSSFLSFLELVLLKQYIASQQPLNQMDTASMDYELTGRNKRMPKKVCLPHSLFSSDCSTIGQPRCSSQFPLVQTRKETKELLIF